MSTQYVPVTGRTPNPGAQELPGSGTLGQFRRRSAKELLEASNLGTGRSWGGTGPGSIAPEHWGIIADTNRSGRQSPRVFWIGP